MTQNILELRNINTTHTNVKKKSLSLNRKGRNDQGGGKFGWSENFNEHPIVNLKRLPSFSFFRSKFSEMSFRLEAIVRIYFNYFNN